MENYFETICRVPLVSEISTGVSLPTTSMAHSDEVLLSPPARELLLARPRRCRRSWTVHDGVGFSRCALSAKHSCPESRQLVEECTTLAIRRNGVAKPAHGSSAAGIMRSFWLVNGVAGQRLQRSSHSFTSGDLSCANQSPGNRGQSKSQHDPTSKPFRMSPI